MIVTSVRTHDWKKDDGTVTVVTDVTLDDGREVPGYDLPAEPEVGKPLPDGWEVATSAKGKPYIKVPNPGRGRSPAAFRNTAQGQAYEQERMDRRTALMQACAISVDAGAVLKLADTYYAWLRKTVGSSSPSQGRADDGGRAATTTHSGPVPTTPPEQTDEGSAGTKAQNRKPRGGASSGGSDGREGPSDPPGVCAHTDTSPLKPDGSALPNGFLRCLACGVVHKEA